MHQHQPIHNYISESTNEYSHQLDQSFCSPILNTVPTYAPKSSGQSILDINYPHSSAYMPISSFNVPSKDYRDILSSGGPSMEIMQSSDTHPNTDMISAAIDNKMVAQIHHLTYDNNQASLPNISCTYDQWNKQGSHINGISHSHLESWSISDMPTSTSIATINANISAPHVIGMPLCMNYTDINTETQSFKVPYTGTSSNRVYYPSPPLIESTSMENVPNVTGESICNYEETKLNYLNPLDEDVSSVSSSSSSNSSSPHHEHMDISSNSGEYKDIYSVCERNIDSVPHCTSSDKVTDSAPIVNDCAIIKSENDTIMKSADITKCNNPSCICQLSKQELIRRVVLLEKERKISKTDGPAQQDVPVDNSDEDESHPCRWANCKMTILSLDQLTVHIKDVHVGSGKAAYYCEWAECPREQKPFLKRHKMQNHMRTHTGERPFVCTKEGCDKKFSRPDSLNTHFKTHSSIRPYACTVENCGKAYFHSRSLRKHAKSHESLSTVADVKEEAYQNRHNPYERPTKTYRYQSSMDLNQKDPIFPQFTPIKTALTYNQGLNSNTYAGNFNPIEFNPQSTSNQHEQQHNNHHTHHEQHVFAAGSASHPMTYRNNNTNNTNNTQDITFVTNNMIIDRYKYAFQSQIL